MSLVKTLEPRYGALIARMLLRQAIESGLGAADLAALERAAGLRFEALEALDATIPFEAEGRLFKALIEITEDPICALRLGLMNRPELSDLVGYYIGASRDVGEALERQGWVCAQMHEAYRLHLSRGPELIRLCIVRVHSARNQPESFDSEEYRLALTLRFIEQIAPARPWPRAVHLCRSDPSSGARARALLETDVLLAQPMTSLVYDGALLEQPLRGADAGLSAVLRGHLERLLEGGPPALSNLVAQALCRGFAEDRADLHSVAAALNLSAATLRRHLREEGTSLQELRERCREQLAHEHLITAGLSVEETAERLGYQDVRSFRRAFHRWHGVSPREYRKRQRGV